MAVVAFPKPEPWPAELFDNLGVADLEQLAIDVAEVIAARKEAAA